MMHGGTGLLDTSDASTQNAPVVIPACTSSRRDSQVPGTGCTGSTSCRPGSAGARRGGHVADESSTARSARIGQWGTMAPTSLGSARPQHRAGTHMGPGVESVGRPLPDRSRWSADIQGIPDARSPMGRSSTHAGSTKPGDQRNTPADKAIVSDSTLERADIPSAGFETAVKQGGVDRRWLVSLAITARSPAKTGPVVPEQGAQGDMGLPPLPSPLPAPPVHHLGLGCADALPWWRRPTTVST